MRKYYLILLLFFSLNLSAQNYKNDGEPYDFYCQIYGELQMSGQILFKRIIWEDYGRRTKLTDEKGKDLEFKNIVDAMNYLSKRGWSFVSSNAYADMFFYTFKKTVKTDEEAKIGLYFKEDFKK